MLLTLSLVLRFKSLESVSSETDYLFTYSGEGNGTPLQYSFAWRVPWMEEPGRLQSMGSLRVGHDWATLLSLFTFTHWRKKWQPTPVFLPGESQGRQSLVAAICGVAQSWTRLKWLSSSSNIHMFSQQTLRCLNVSPCPVSGNGSTQIRDTPYIHNAQTLEKWVCKKL